MIQPIPHDVKQVGSNNQLIPHDVKQGKSYHPAQRQASPRSPQINMFQGGARSIMV